MNRFIALLLVIASLFLASATAEIHAQSSATAATIWTTLTTTAGTLNSNNSNGGYSRLGDKCFVPSQRKDCADLSCNASSNLCAPCLIDDDCFERAMACQAGRCVVAPFFGTFNAWSFFSVLLSFTVCVTGLVAGVGGGGVLVPLYSGITGLPVSHAVFTSLATILGQGIVNVPGAMQQFDSEFPHTGPVRPRPAYDLICLWFPVVAIGSYIGQLTARFLPSWMRMGILFILAVFLTVRVINKARREREQEQKEAREAEAMMTNEMQSVARFVAEDTVTGEQRDAANDENTNNNSTRNGDGSQLYSVPNGKQNGDKMDGFPPLLLQEDSKTTIAMTTTTTTTTTSSSSPAKKKRAARKALPYVGDQLYEVDQRESDADYYHPPPKKHFDDEDEFEDAPSSAKPETMKQAADSGSVPAGDGNAKEQAAVAAAALLEQQEKNDAEMFELASQRPDSISRLWWKEQLIVLFVMGCAVIVARFVLKNEADNFCGSGLFWGMLFVGILVNLAVFALYRFRMAQLAAQIEKGELHRLWLPFAWTPNKSIGAPLLSFAAGFTASLAGIGGGLLLNPLMLEVGLSNTRSSATGNVITALIALQSMLVAAGDIDPQLDYTLVFAVVGGVSTLMGRYWILPKIQRRKATWLITALMAVILVLSLVASLAVGLLDLVRLLHAGADISVGNLCTNHHNK